MDKRLARIADTRHLFPEFAARLELGLRKARDQGLAVYVFETLRTPERQEAIFAQGRTLPGAVITNARGWSSWHQYGLAADLAFDADVKTPKVEWTWSGAWKRLGAILTSAGLQWYGTPGSPFREAPHFQLTGGLPIALARRLKDEGGLPMVWAEVERRLKEIAA